jgi:hypothetical protein
MSRAPRLLALVLGVAFVGVQFMRPERENPEVRFEDSLQALSPMSPEAAAVFDRSCRDCHSNETRWPWYSEVAPVSWFVAGHVDHARRHLNVSEWSRYDRTRAAHKIEEMCEEAREGRMPLPSYLWIHHGARTSSADVEALCAWSAAARAAMGATERPVGEQDD